MNVADILERAADLIEPEGAWTQESFARDEYGGLSGPLVCWCAAGAIWEIAGSADQTADMAAAFASQIAQPGIHQAVPWGPLVAFNDAPERTQAEVVAKLREAAQVARGLILRGRG